LERIRRGGSAGIGADQHAVFPDAQVEGYELVRRQHLLVPDQCPHGRLSGRTMASPCRMTVRIPQGLGRDLDPAPYSVEPGIKVVRALQLNLQGAHE
jgi:hypothetical protein